MTSIVFQSGTAKRPRFPSRTMTPEYIWRNLISNTAVEKIWCSYITSYIATKKCNGECFHGSSLVGVVNPFLNIS